MKYLLDTHTAIWALKDKANLSKAVKEIIDDVSIPLCVSIISAWEIAIKVSIGKLNFAGGAASFLEKMRHNGVEILTVNSSYIELLKSCHFSTATPLTVCLSPQPRRKK